MIEMLTLITLATVFLLLFRPGKTPPLNNPLVIQRPGQYHMTLAPQINLAQPFIESIAKRLGDPSVLAPNSATLCFEVRDKEVTAHGQDSYLLAITQRNGMLYFQAAASEIAAFADKVLADIPRSGAEDETLNGHIVAEANAAAQQRGIALTRL
jgi:hypothetical protein